MKWENDYAWCVGKDLWQGGHALWQGTGIITRALFDTFLSGKAINLCSRDARFDSVSS